MEAAYKFWLRQSTCRPTWDGLDIRDLIAQQAPQTDDDDCDDVVIGEVCCIDGVRVVGDSEVHQLRAKNKARLLSHYRDPATVKAERETKEAKYERDAGKRQRAKVTKEAQQANARAVSEARALDPRGHKNWRDAVATLGLTFTPFRPMWSQAGKQKPEEVEAEIQAAIPTAEQFKSAYRAKAKQHHPDHGGDAVQFHAVKAAYDYVTHWAPQTFNFDGWFWGNTDKTQ